MFPTINKKETGVNLRRIMDMKSIKPRDIQEYLGLGCVQSIYRWLDGVSMPTVDNLYAISKMLQVPMDSIVCGNARTTEEQMNAYEALIKVLDSPRYQPIEDAIMQFVAQEVDEGKMSLDKGILMANGIIVIYDFWITDKMIRNEKYTKWQHIFYKL